MRTEKKKRQLSKERERNQRQLKRENNKEGMQSKEKIYRGRKKNERRTEQRNKTPRKKIRTQRLFCIVCTQLSPSEMPQ